MAGSCTAFCGSKQIASGDLKTVVLKAKAAMDSDKWAQVLVFDDNTSNLVEVDFRGTPADVLKRLNAIQRSEPAETEGEQRKPGRPKLGVVAREVTLLPRHWEWLSTQPGGASVALRKLVEHARHSNEGKDRRRKAQETAYRFMSALAGNEPGFEEAIRALFAGQSDRFDQTTKPWPIDVRKHARKLAAAAFLKD